MGSYDKDLCFKFNKETRDGKQMERYSALLQDAIRSIIEVKEERDVMSLFSAGETVSGIVRSVEDYGIFIELTPNLAGLAEAGRQARTGQHASVYIKAVIPEKMKIKLIIVDIFDAEYRPTELKYFYEGDRIKSWRYTPDAADKTIESYF